MLKIVEKAYSNHPIRFMVKPGVKLIAGYACILTEYNGYMVCDICPPRKNAFGIIGSTRKINSKNVSFNIKNFVSIWHQRMIFQTNNFEHSNYCAGDKLYVGESGMLTNEQVTEDVGFVARLIGYPNDRRVYYEALWI